MELELSAKSRRARERVLRAYGGQTQDRRRRLPDRSPGDRPGGRRLRPAPQRRRSRHRAHDRLRAGLRRDHPGAHRCARDGRSRSVSRRAAPADGATGTRARRGRPVSPAPKPPQPPYWLLAVFVAGVRGPAGVGGGDRSPPPSRCAAGLGLARAALAREEGRRRAAAIGPTMALGTDPAGATGRPGRAAARRPRPDRRGQRRRQDDDAAARSSATQVARGRPVVAIDLKGSPAFARRLGAARRRPRRAACGSGRLDGPERLEPAGSTAMPTELKDKLIATERFTEPHYQRAAERYVQTRPAGAGTRPTPAVRHAR